MSLTSRVVNFFSGSIATPHEDRNELTYNGLPGGEKACTSVGMGTELIRSEGMALQALEEEARPPYLHVGRTIPSCTEMGGNC